MTATARPPWVRGNISPYPTVVIVMITNQNMLAREFESVRSSTSSMHITCNVRHEAHNGRLWHLQQCPRPEDP